MKSISKLKDEARRQEQREEWEKAIQTYLQVIRIGDEGEGEVELPLFNRIGDLCVRLGRPHDAVRYYEEAADRYADAGLYNNAIALCNKALRYEPDHLELMRKLGQFSASQGFLTDARRHFLDYAERKFKSGEVDAALSALADFAGVVDDGEIRELLGRRLHKYGRTDDALRELRTAYAMFVHTGEPDRAESVRATILAIDPETPLDAADAAGPDPSAAAGTARVDDLPRFEPLGVQHGAGLPAPPPPATTTPVEGLEPTGHGAAGDTAEAYVDDLPYLDIDEAPATVHDAKPSAEPVAGFESTTLDLDAARLDVDTLDLGPGIEREATSFETLDAGPAETGMLPVEEGHEAAVEEATDEETGFDLPYLDDEPSSGFDLPLLSDDEPEAAPLPFLDAEPESVDADEAEPLPFLDDGESFDDVDAPPLPLIAEPPSADETTAPSPWDPVEDDDRDFDLASFEDDPPSLRQQEPPARTAEPPPTVAGDDMSFELPEPLRGTSAAEPLMFEVDEPAAPSDTLRFDDLAPIGHSTLPEAEAEADVFAPGEPESGDADAGDRGEPTAAHPLFDIPGWVEDELNAEDERDTGDVLPEPPAAEMPVEPEAGDVAYGAPTAEPAPGDLDTDDAPPLPLLDDASPGEAFDAVVFGTDADDADLYLPVEDEDGGDRATDSWLAIPSAGDEASAVADLDGLPELPAPRSFELVDDDDDDDVLGGLDLVDAAQEEDRGRSALAEQQAAAEAVPEWEAPPAPAPHEPDSAEGELATEPPAGADEPAPWSDEWEDGEPFAPEEFIEEGPPAREPAFLDAGSEWTPGDLEGDAVTDVADDAALDLADGTAAEPAAAGAEDAAVEPVGEEDEAFVDLGALVREDAGQQGTTRFYVQETPPTGDEDRDFAELLNQFKTKISENVPAEDAAAHYDLALAYKEMGLLDEAIAEFQIALRAGRMRLKIYEELGECFLQKRQFNIAEKVLSRALATNFDDEIELLGVYYHLGRAYEEMGRTEQARDAYERVLGMDIGFQDVAERLARL